MTDDVAQPAVTFVLNGSEVTVPADGTLLTALRERLPAGSRRIVSVKDGCAPQGQCGCCTVWVDGEPRVSCVTPVARVSGRQITTLEGTDASVRSMWSEALCSTGGSQCGFCTPGIIMRLAVLEDLGRESVDKALLAHLCRCTGWHTIRQAAQTVDEARRSGTRVAVRSERDLAAASRRADLEGHAHQTVHPRIALGDGGFAEDIAPGDALVAVLDPAGEWVTGSDPASARRAAGVVPGRKSTVPISWPVHVQHGHPGAPDSNDIVRTLITTWVEPAYLEPDALWCVPGGEPVGPLINGGAFGGKSDPVFVDDLRSVARRLADDHGRAVRVVLSREDVVRRAPKRPPMALAVRADGSGVMWAARTPGLRDLLERIAADWDLIEVDVPGPPTSVHLRAAGWAEIAVMRCSVREPVEIEGERWDHVVAPHGAQAWARLEGSSVGVIDRIHVRVQCGAALDDTVLRSYCIGAAHMALGWVRTEGLATDVIDTGEPDVVRPVDLTIRSFGVVRSVDTPEITVEILDDADGQPCNGSDAVFAAVAAAVWRFEGFPPAWPTRR